MTTLYHAKCFAYELTRQGGAGVERLSRSLFDACVDLNPHQVEDQVRYVGRMLGKLLSCEEETRD